MHITLDIPKEKNARLEVADQLLSLATSNAVISDPTRRILVGVAEGVIAAEAKRVPEISSPPGKVVRVER